MARVVAIAGAMASGKSDLSRRLAEDWSCPRASFGAFVADVARRRDLPLDRDTLQDLGTILIGEMGWEDFCERTVALAGADWLTDPVVIDGVRHLDAIATLRSRFAPTPVLLVFVSCDPEVRRARLIERGATSDDIERWDADPTEQAGGALRGKADLHVRGDAPMRQAMSAIDLALSP